MASYIVATDVAEGYKDGVAIPPRPEGYTRFALASDTHSIRLGPIPADTDIFIHGGDLTRNGRPEEIKAAVNDIAALPSHVTKVFIAGNHDFTLDEKWTGSEGNYFSLTLEHTAQLKEYIAETCKRVGNMYYLEDEALEICPRKEGKKWKVYGTPFSNQFYDWAFMSDAHPFPEVPKETEILITHGPAYGILDLTRTRVKAGGGEVLEAVKEVKPRLYVFGHIHEARGLEELKTDDGDVPTVCVNASSIRGMFGGSQLWGVIVIDLKDEI